MYNIAKVAKGEILPFFNDIFDALAKVRLSELSSTIVAVLICWIAGVRLGAFGEKWSGASRPFSKGHCR